MNDASTLHDAAGAGGPGREPSVLHLNRAAGEDAVVDLVDDREPPPRRGVLRTSHSEDSMDVMIPPDMVAMDDHGEDIEDDNEDDEYEDSEDDDHSSYGGEEEEHEGEEEDEEEGEDEADDDEIQEHLDGSVSDQPSPHLKEEPEIVSDLPHDSVSQPAILAHSPDPGTGARQSPNKAAPGTPPAPNVVHDRGLDFDMNEPWQRSLLRQFQSHYDQPRVRSPAVLVAVGHTESRDYAVDVVRGSMRDDLTLTTESSSSLPYHRPQVIHRPWIYPDDHAALFEDDQTHSTADPHHHHHHHLHHHHQGRPKPPAGGVGTASERVSPRSHREEREASAAAVANYYGSSNRYYFDVPPTTRDAGMQAKRSLMVRQQQHQHQQHSPPWLEMEAPSMGGNSAATAGGGGGGGHDDLDDATTVAVASANQDACFCMGYNVLDFWMPPGQAGGSSRVRSRKGGPRHPTSRRHAGGGSGGGRRPYLLGKVAEEGSVSADLGGDRPIIHTIPSSSRSVARSVDPDGAYNSHPYTTTTTTATTTPTTSAAPHHLAR